MSLIDMLKQYVGGSSRALASVAGGGILSTLLVEGTKSLTPEEAQKVSPETVQQLASHAEQNDPSIVEWASSFYARHPTLVKTLRAGVLSVAMAQLGQRRAA